MAVNRAARSPSPVNNNMSFTKNWCSSRQKMLKCNYTWTIHNFSFYQEAKNEVLKSSLFSAGSKGELKWRLHLYPNGDGEENKGHMSIFVRLEECDKPEISALFEFAIMDAKGNKTNCLESERRTFKRVKDHWGSYGWKKFVTLATLNNERNRLLSNNRLTIFCEIKALKETYNVANQNQNIKQFNVPPCSLSNDLKATLDNKKFSDVVFKVADQTFYAHKVILAARSPVFSAMFSQEKKEQKVLTVNVSEVTKDIFEEILRYIYTGKSPNLEDIADGLLAAAHHYGLCRLKVMCEEQISKNLRINNAADVLIMADQYEAEQLKIQARDFIISHVEDVKGTEGFKAIVKSHPKFLVEALSVLAMKVNGNLE